jgi:glutamyl-tRNA synthetase
LSASTAPVVTRFAPSPTGFLHIGGARTALFNWLFARHHGGKFLLRIEDTDKARSTQAAIDAILEGMRWLELDWDGETVFQSARVARHVEVAHQLLASGSAYRCFATPEELDAMRTEQRANKQPQRYDGRWRDRACGPEQEGAPFAVRLKAPRGGETVIEDAVQGRVVVQNSELDDMILLRSDGTPTYMLAVVVDDHDMGVTHVIRGDDHLNNAFRQLGIIKAMGWPEPIYAHVPLIHGADGAKMSKRHGATGVMDYDAAGFLPEAISNYLLRLGWGHGDTEILSREEAVRLFSLDGIGRSPSRFDLKKLEHLNGHYIREASDERLAGLAAPRIESRFGAPLSDQQRALLTRAMPALKPRAKDLNELAEAGILPVQGAALGHGRQGRRPATGLGQGPARPPHSALDQCRTGPARRQSRPCVRCLGQPASSSARWRSRSARRSPDARPRRGFSMCWCCSGATKASPGSRTR